MKRHMRPNAAFHPILAWSTLALTTSEMLLASAQVIAHRTGRIAMSSLPPNARDQKEFTLMAQEKVEAVTESMQAIALHAMSINQRLGMLAFKQLLSVATGFTTLGANPTLAHCGKRQRQVVANAMAGAATSASRLSGSLAGLAQHGLKPVHARATGNAKRLLKKRG